MMNGQRSVPNIYIGDIFPSKCLFVLQTTKLASLWELTAVPDNDAS